MNVSPQIILIEDNASDAELIIRAFQKNKIANELLHLKDGVEALDYFFAKGNYSGRDINDLPKVILLDLKMPKIDGMEVLLAIKSDKRTRHIPVVLLTSSNESRDIHEGYQLGANSYIVKPINFDDFVKAMRDLGFYWLLLNQPPK